MSSDRDFEKGAVFDSFVHQVGTDGQQPGDDGHKFIVKQGENGSLPTYQSADGAPIEVKSPLGYHVQHFTMIFLNVGQMIGTGVFSTPSSILSGTGSVGLSLIYWMLGFVISAAALAVYLELASYFPSRSGAEPVYLEQAYPRPRHLMSTTFAIQTVITSFSASNAVVAATYLFQTAGRTPSDWEAKGVAVAAYTLALFFVLFNSKLGLYTSNIIGVIKIITLVFISITGLVVLGGHTKVQPTTNFQNSFHGSTPTGYGIANALVKIWFSYSGYANAFNVVAETKDPIRTIRRSAPISLLIVAILYILCAIAYFSAVPAATLKAGGQAAAGQFFTVIFGKTAARALNILIVISAFGNLVSVLIGQSRVIREVGRQGVIPWPNAWSSVWPFGTPTLPYLTKWALTLVVILACPAGDAFNFVVDLGTYPQAFFLLFMSIGVYTIRRQRAKAGIGRSEFRAWDPVVIFSILVNLFMVIMPWVPPAAGPYSGDVSFWYATYCAVALGIIALSALYYYIWMWVIPRFGGYEKRQEIVELSNGAQNHRFVSVPRGQLAEWDATHDKIGNKLTQRVGFVSAVGVSAESTEWKGQN